MFITNLCMNVTFKIYIMHTIIDEFILKNQNERKSYHHNVSSHTHIHNLLLITETEHE